MWLRVLVGFVILMHGLAHFAGVGAARAKRGSGFGDQSWIFSRGVSYQSQVGRSWALIWAAAVLPLVAAGPALMTGRAWWPAAAIVGAVVSLVAIVPWWRAVVPGARLGVLLDVAILVALLGPWKEAVLRFLA